MHIKLTPCDVQYLGPGPELQYVGISFGPRDERSWMHEVSVPVRSLEYSLMMRQYRSVRPSVFQVTNGGKCSLDENPH